MQHLHRNFFCKVKQHGSWRWIHCFTQHHEGCFTWVFITTKNHFEALPEPIFVNRIKFSQSLLRSEAFTIFLYNFYQWSYTVQSGSETWIDAVSWSVHVQYEEMPWSVTDCYIGDNWQTSSLLKVFRYLWISIAFLAILKIIHYTVPQY